MTIQAIIFDMGGVILRTQNPEPRRKWIERAHVTPDIFFDTVFRSPVARRAEIGQATDKDVWRHAGQVFGLDDSQLEEFEQDFWSALAIDAALVQFIRGLRPRYKTAVLSNAWPDARRLIEDNLDFRDVVDVMFFSAEEGMAKPDPCFYHLATERLQIQPQQAIFIDDRTDNVEAAQALGMRGVQFQNTQQTIDEVRAYLES